MRTFYQKHVIEENQYSLRCLSNEVVLVLFCRNRWSTLYSSEKKSKKPSISKFNDNCIVCRHHDTGKHTSIKSELFNFHQRKLNINNRVTKMPHPMLSSSILVSESELLFRTSFCLSYFITFLFLYSQVIASIVPETTEKLAQN